MFVLFVAQPKHSECLLFSPNLTRLFFFFDSFSPSFYPLFFSLPTFFHPYCYRLSFMVNVNAVRICTVTCCRLLFVAAEFHQTKLSTDLHAQIYLFFFFPTFLFFS